MAISNINQLLWYLWTKYQSIISVVFVVVLHLIKATWQNAKIPAGDHDVMKVFSIAEENISEHRGKKILLIHFLLLFIK